MLDLAYFQWLAWFFGLFVVAGLGAPFPEELLIVGAGIWTATNPEYGVFRWLMLPVCIAGVLIADIFLYTVGRVFGSRLLDHRWVSWMVPAHKRQRIEKNFHDYGVGILIFGRLLPGIRLPLFLTSGILRLPVPRFILADALGAIVGNSILFFLAFWFGDALQDFLNRIKMDIDKSRPLFIMILIAGLGVFFVFHFWRKPVTEGDPKELPIFGTKIADHMSTDQKVTPAPSTNGNAGKTEHKAVEGERSV